MMMTTSTAMTPPMIPPMLLATNETKKRNSANKLPYTEVDHKQE